MTKKSAFGLSHCGVRAGRGMTAADAAADAGLNVSTIRLIETGKRRVDTRLATALVEVCALTVDERVRLAAGWSRSGFDGDPVSYDVKPGSGAGYFAAASIIEIITQDLAVRSDGVPA